MSNNSEILRVRQLISECAPDVFKRCPVLFSYLYGSYARGDVHPFSDIDIGIYIETSIPEKTLNIELSLGLEFDDVIGGGCNVDVRSINNMPLMMKGKIVTEGLLLYSRDDLLRVEFETNVRKVYFDFKPYILRYQKAYLGTLLNSRREDANRHSTGATYSINSSSPSNSKNTTHPISKLQP